MKKYLPLLSILLLASVLRLYQLGINPPSLDWDEASLGYNAYSILKTGKDEFGNFLPLSIRSFNDYKPPLYTYLDIPFIATFGLNELAVRLPSALVGIIAVAACYYLTLEIFKAHKHSLALAQFSSLLLAISPWHLQFSRAAFEANLALTFYLLSVLFFLKWINTKVDFVIGNWFLVIAASSAAAALYSYHSARLIVPAMFLFLALKYKYILFQRWRTTSLALALAIILLAPLLYITFRGGTSNRFNTVSIFTNPGEFSREAERLNRAVFFRSQDPIPLSYMHHPYTVYAKIILRNYFEHFNFDFLFLTGDGNGRHTSAGMGLLYLASLPLLLYGFFSLAKDKSDHSFVVWLWLLLGPLAAAITADTPHVIRSLLMLPAIQILTAYGIISVFQRLQSTKSSYVLRYSLYGGFVLLFSLNVFFYLKLYYFVSPHERSQDWQYGYKQLVFKVNKIKSNYDNIYITNKYDQPQVFFAFYTPIDPNIYQTYAETAHEHIENITFKDIEYRTDIQDSNSIVIADPADSPSDAHSFDQIRFLDGTTAFNFFSSQ